MVGGGFHKDAEAEPGHRIEADALLRSQLAEKLQHLGARVVHIGPGNVAFIDQQDGGAGFGRLGRGGRRVRVRDAIGEAYKGRRLCCCGCGLRRGGGSGGGLIEEPDLLLAAAVVNLEVAGFQVRHGVALFVVGHYTHVDQSRDHPDREATRGRGLIGWTIGYAFDCVHADFGND